MRRIVIALALLVLASGSARTFAPSGVQTAGVFYYVATTGNDSNSGTISAPFLTITQAQTVVRAALAGGTKDITVYLRDGAYTIASTLAFTSADSPPAGHNVTWASYPGEKAVISGGVQVTGWAVCTTADTICNSGTGSPTYQATVSSPTDFREFYFCPDGTFATCVHRDVSHTASPFPGGFTIDTSNGTVTAPGGAGAPFNAAWANPIDVEVVWQNMWESPRCKASSVTVVGGKTTIAQQTPCATTWNGWFFANYTNFGGAGDYLKAFESAYELMTSQGDVGCGAGSGCWYYNHTTHVLYYQPKGGENMATAISFVPKVDKLLTGSGVSNLTFDRLTWAFSTWLGPNSGNGFMEMQSGIWCTSTVNCQSRTSGGSPLEPALDFSTSSHDLTFSHNLFTHNAGRALLFEHTTQNVSLVANDFEDNGGGGVQYGDITDAAESNVTLQTCCLTAVNNKFNSGGFEYHSDEFFAPRVRDLTLTNNEFDNVQWNAISTGWGWTSTSNYTARLNISNNYLNGFCLGGQLFDCGGIYNNSATAAGPNMIASNYVKGLGPAPNYNGGGIYPDEETTGFVISNNVVDGPLTAHSCGGPPPAGGCGINLWSSTVSGVIATYPWYSTSSKYLNNGTGTSIADPIVFTSGSPPAGAQAVINAAGIPASITPGP